MKRKISFILCIALIVSTVYISPVRILQAQAAFSEEGIVNNENISEAMEREDKTQSMEASSIEDGEIAEQEAADEEIDIAPGAAADIGTSTYTLITIGDYVLDGTVLVSYAGTEANVTIPESLGITEIGYRAFYTCQSLISVSIPSSVTSIGEEAFSWCENLTSIDIPGTVTSIGDRAFTHCDNLTDINVPNSVTSIGEEAFSWCGNLTSIDIPDNITSIGNRVFAQCENLIGISIPGSVTSIGDGAFFGCDNITSVTIPDSVTSIGDWAFSWCTGLTGIDLPDSVTSIGELAFSHCTSLININIPNSVTNIERYVFDGCLSLTSVTIPDSVTSIGVYAFSGCSNLTSVTIPDSVTSIGEGAFSGCSGLTSVLIPDSVTSIGVWAFSWCASLTSITIPASVTSIGNDAFKECPDNLTIRGYKSSYAETYAKSNNILFESISVEEFVMRLYETVLGRSADAQGLKTWTTGLNSGKHTGASVVQAFYNSAEYKNKNTGNADFVESVYKTMLNRGSDVSGKANWLGCLTDGVSRNYVLKGFVGSNEFTNLCKQYGIERGSITLTEYRDKNINATRFVQRLYRTCLGRTADTHGLNTWTKGLITGTHTGASVVLSFYNSSEYKNKNTSNSDFVESAYKTMLNRGSDAAGKANWLGCLTDGVSRTYVIKGFVGSNEFTNLCKQYGIEKGSITLTEYRDKNINTTRFVQRLYSTCLGRTADTQGLNTWTKGLITGTHTGASMVWSFYNSNEYKGKKASNETFVESVYKTMLNRSSDAEGKANWVNYLKQGYSRKYVLIGFVGSSEFTNLCKTYGVTRGSIAISSSDKPAGK